MSAKDARGKYHSAPLEHSLKKACFGFDFMMHLAAVTSAEAGMHLSWADLHRFPLQVHERQVFLQVGLFDLNVSLFRGDVIQAKGRQEKKIFLDGLHQQRRVSSA